MLNKEQILNADDLQIETVEVPEWSGSVCVRTLSGAERDSFEESLFTGIGKDRQTKMANVRARLCGLVICDEKGNRLFTAADIERLGKKSCRPLDRIYEVAQRLSGISDTDVEEMVKNSEAVQSEDSISD